jgi:hypothetical protein
LLRRIGAQLNADIRGSDTVGALAGGYAVIHTETSLAGTELSAGRLRDSIVHMIGQRFPEVSAPDVSVTSASYPASGSTVEALVETLTGVAIGESGDSEAGAGLTMGAAA